MNSTSLNWRKISETRFGRLFDGLDAIARNTDLDWSLEYFERQLLPFYIGEGIFAFQFLAVLVKNINSSLVRFRYHNQLTITLCRKIGA